MTQQKTTLISCFALLGVLFIAVPGSFAQLGPQTAEERIKNMEAPERVADLKLDEVIKKLDLKPGDIVADIGAGAGVFSIAMARAVAPNGIVYAVEIEQDFLDFINKSAKKENITNIRTVLGGFNDPNLPTKDVDVAFFHRVLHHIERRYAYLDTTARYLEPDGRIVLLEKAPEDVQNWMWLKREDVDTWMAALGFYPAQRFALYDDKWFVAYQRPLGNSVLLKKRGDGTPAGEKKPEEKKP